MYGQQFKNWDFLAPAAYGRHCCRSRLRSILWLLYVRSWLRFWDMENFLDSFLGLYLARNRNWIYDLDYLAKIFRSLNLNDFGRYK
jgi:hypothetical protein